MFQLFNLVCILSFSIPFISHGTRKALIYFFYILFFSVVLVQACVFSVISTSIMWYLDVQWLIDWRVSGKKDLGDETVFL